MATTGHESEAINVQGLKASLQKLKTNHIDGKIASTEKGAASGVATLGSDGKVPSSQLPSYVDDVLEYANKSSFPATGETGKIYVDKSTDTTWRWSGSAYTQIKGDLALGETSSTAYRGDRGKTAYDHSQSTHARTDATKTEASSTNGNIKINGTETTVYTHPGSGTNPHGTTKSDVGLGNVGNFKAVSTAASQGLTATEQANARTNIASVGETINTTWSELKTMRDGGTLAPGQWYRITDYECTTMQENTQAASNQFDILVLATSSDTLSENARATKHSGDYFGNIDAWQLRYTLDNVKWSRQTGLFATSSDHGYSFKKVGTIVLDGDTYILWEGDSNFQDDWCNYAVSLNSNEGSSLYAYYEDGEFSDENVDTIGELNEVTEPGKGTVLWMKDEFDNECPYDFKNIQFKRYKATDANSRDSINGKYMVADPNNPPRNITGDSSDFIWAYTFSSNASGGAQSDASLDSGVHDNVFRKYGDSLPNNVIYGYKTYANSFGCNCYNNSIGNNFNNNSIGNGFKNNSIGEYCNYNTIGNGFQYNTIGNDCYRNSIGNDCYYNTIGNNFNNNSIGNYFQFNSIGNNCYNNSIGNGFQYNTIGNDCYRNSIGNGFQNNSIGNGFYNNSIGNDCSENSIGNYFQFNSIGNGCQNIRIQKDFVYYIIIENGNQYIDITSTQTTSNSNKLQNFTVAQGVNNTTTRKTISHNSVNDTFKTTYQNASSTTVNV